MGDKRKILIVYYTFDGNTGYAARILQKYVGGDLLRLRVGKKPPKKGPGKYLFGGLDAAFHMDPHLAAIDVDPQDYEIVILAGPVWAGTYCPAIGRFIEENPFTDKEVFLVGTSKSGNAEGMFDRIKKILPDNHVVSSLSLKEPLKNPEEAEREIETFCIMIG